MSNRPQAEAMVAQSFCIPDIGPSANEFFGRMHPQQRRRIVTAWHGLVWGWCQKYAIRPVRCCVDLEIICHFGPDPLKRGNTRRAFDSSNCSATAKLIEDGLVAAQILRGDGPKYVRWVRLLSVPRQVTTQTVVMIAEVGR